MYIFTYRYLHSTPLCLKNHTDKLVTTRICITPNGHLHLDTGELILSHLPKYNL